MTTCENCEQDYDEVRCHWRCPECGWKESCCEGAPLNPSLAGNGFDPSGATVAKVLGGEPIPATGDAQ